MNKRVSLIARKLCEGSILKNMTKRAQYEERITQMVMASEGLSEVEEIISNFKKRLTERFFKMWTEQSKEVTS